MTRFLVALFATFLTFGFIAEEAEARRLGGSRSFGMQRSAPKAAPATPQRGAANAAQPRRNSWLGPIAGLAAGLGLAALFSHLGLGEGMATFVMLALLAFAAIALFRRFVRPRTDTQAGMQYAGHTQRAPQAPPSPGVAPVSGGGSSAAAAHADFDEAGFLRQAKLNFVRLQAAYDIGNMDDIRAFTSPEVFAEVKMQYDERAGAEQKTDVVELEGDLLEVAEEGDRYIVSVRFHGMIREEENTPPSAFEEIWHMTKPVRGEGGWLVSGIQQAH